MERYLHKAVNSILTQNFNDYEIILVDDGSTDKSGEICDYYSNKYNFIRVVHKANGGLDSARNVGLQNVGGKYFTFIDPDDEILPNYFSNIYKNVIDTNSDILIYGWYIHYTSSNADVIFPLKIHGNICPDDAIRFVASPNDHLGGGYTWNKVYRNTKDNVKFDESLWRFEDKLWNIQTVLRLPKIFAVSECYYKYTIRPSSLSHDENKITKGTISGVEAYKKILTIKDISENNRKYITAVLNTIIIGNYYNAIKAENYELCKALDNYYISRGVVGPKKIHVYIKYLLIKLWRGTNKIKRNNAIEIKRKNS